MGTEGSLPRPQGPAFSKMGAGPLTGEQGRGDGPQISGILSTQGNWERNASLPLPAAEGQGGKMFNVKTSDKVPSGYIFCIKEVALGNSRLPLTRKHSSMAPDGYRHPGSTCQGDSGRAGHRAPSAHTWMWSCCVQARVLSRISGPYIEPAHSPEDTGNQGAVILGRDIQLDRHSPFALGPPTCQLPQQPASG